MSRRIVSISTNVYLVAAIALLLVPIKWLIAIIICAAIHELFHIAAIKCFGLDIYSIHIDCNGAKLYTQSMTCIQELVCALAGPFGSLALLIFARQVPIIGVCAVFQSIWNLLPVYPSDGSRALHCCLRLVFNEKYASVIGKAIEYTAAVFVSGTCLYFALWLKLGVLPLVAGIVFAMRKIPCKERRVKVQ